MTTTTRRGGSRTTSPLLWMLAWLALATAPGAARGETGRGSPAAHDAARPAIADTTLALRDLVALYPRAAGEVRMLLHDQALLERELAVCASAGQAARDSLEVRAAALEREAAWWRSQRQRWWQSPGVVAGVTAVVVAVVVVGSLELVVD